MALFTHRKQVGIVKRYCQLFCTIILGKAIYVVYIYGWGNYTL